jgi:lipoprotein-anchoring transpeptidase ErfK/SrfK
MDQKDDHERMANDQIERRCRAALHARAVGAVSDARAVPPMSDPLGPGWGGPGWDDPTGPTGPTGAARVARRRIQVWWAVPAGALLAVAVAATALVLTRGSGAHHNHQAAAPAAASVAPPSVAPHRARPAAASTSASSAAANVGPAQTVRVTALENDGATYGVGMPIVLYLSPVPTDATAFENAVRVTVNGQPVNGAWFWEQPTADDVNGNIVEAHYRPQQYWPADSTVHVSIPIGGLSAGPGLAYSSKLSSLDYKIGDAHITDVDASALSMRVNSNGRLVRTVGVSLGAAATPTFNGVKVVMQRGEDVPGTNKLRPNGTVMMSGPGYTNDPVQWSVRITESGEYLHAAPWNNGIGERSTSNGCTNLHTDDASWFYHFSQIGDVVQYVHTDGSRMPTWDGLGDWNVPWAQWTQGGLLKH